jgi:hypothetical protein
MAVAVQCSGGDEGGDSGEEAADMVVATNKVMRQINLFICALRGFIAFYGGAMGT